MTPSAERVAVLLRERPHTTRELCEKTGYTHDTIYKAFEQFRDEGDVKLMSRSTRPAPCPHCGGALVKAKRRGHWDRLYWVDGE